MCSQPLLPGYEHWRLDEVLPAQSNGLENGVQRYLPGAAGQARWVGGRVDGFAQHIHIRCWSICTAVSATVSPCREFEQDSRSVIRAHHVNTLNSVKCHGEWYDALKQYQTI
jgi:hypothetical protein